VKRYINNLKLKVLGYLINSGPLVYNLLRAVSSVIDGVKINKLVKSGVPFVLIYQQGRVASTSVYESMRSINLPYPIYHVHTLSMDRAKNEIDKLKQHGGKIYRHLFVGQKLASEMDRLDWSAQQEPWKVISIFRDPIEIMLSLYFLNIESNPNGLLTKVENSDKDSVLKYIENLFENSEPAGWAVCNWYDNIFLDELEVDVYVSPFDKEKGYTVINTKKFDILLIRFEDIKNAYSEGLAVLFGLDASNLNLKHMNLHRNDKFSDLHKYIKENLKLSRGFCERVYSTKLMKHFYSSELIQELTHKWIREE